MARNSFVFIMLISFLIPSCFGLVLQSINTDPKDTPSVIDFKKTVEDNFRTIEINTGQMDKSATFEGNAMVMTVTSVPATNSGTPEGMLWADSVTHKLKYYDGTAWQNMF